jgi:hypothetical protein
MRIREYRLYLTNIYTLDLLTRKSSNLQIREYYIKNKNILTFIFIFKEI